MTLVRIYIKIGLKMKDTQHPHHTKRLAFLKEKSAGLSSGPGCYLMKSKDGNIIYVGKAKNLKARVKSYFQSSEKGPKTQILVSHIIDFDFFLTDNETEALILENNLIKKYLPKYNIRLKDDKTYPYVLINNNEVYPRLQYIRNPKKKKGYKIFGPFVMGSNISEVLKVLTRSFELRDCSLREFKSRKEACLLYQMKQCSAPCVGYVDELEYAKQLKYALNFFEAKGQKSLSYLESKMNHFASKEEFERAAQIRDDAALLQDFLVYSNQKNTETFGSDTDFDVLSFASGELEIDFSIYMTRNGVLIGKKNFHFSKFDLQDEFEESVMTFLVSYYESTFESHPKKIICDLSSEFRESLENVLNKLWDTQVQVLPVKSKFKSLYNLTKEHAAEQQLVRSNNKSSVYLALDRLKDLLSLKERPVLLECYDVAIWQGSSPSASQVVYHLGVADKSAYRFYALKERPEKNNDFAMMKELIARRIKHGNLPDVFIVDGGKGQVSSFKAVLDEHEITIPVVGIAKAKTKDNSRTQERLIIPGRLNPYILNKNRSLLTLITSMRDEAHRFSRVLHHKKEKKKFIATWIDEVSGIGPVTRGKILKNLTQTKEELKNLSAQEISSALDISQKIAKNIKNYLEKNLLS
ncbi:excinuclease ABC subunit UvrC [bacterium]|nr:excinuclease ABC subunit UvrC [bacterium]